MLPHKLKMQGSSRSRKGTEVGVKHMNLFKFSCNRFKATFAAIGPGLL